MHKLKRTTDMSLERENFRCKQEILIGADTEQIDGGNIKLKHRAREEGKGARS